MPHSHVLMAGVLACWIGSVPTAASPMAGKVKRPEEELLLFALRLDQATLVEAFPAYPLASGGLALPLGHLCRALGIGIRLDTATGQAAGFIINERRRFRLDLGAARVERDSRTEALDRSQVEWHEDDLYVAIPLLEQWLPVTLAADPLDAALRVDPREELPVQEEQRRLKRQSRLGAARPEAEAFPLVTAPYALWDVPFVNQNLDLTYRPNVPPGSPRLGLAGATYLSGDLLYMSSSVFFTSRSGNLTDNARATLFRQDPDGGLLGPLGARTVALGDIFVQQAPLIGGVPAGRGLKVGNLPDTVVGGADRYTLRGTLLPGWTVEVYQNEILVAFQRYREDGLYEFPDLPLRFGASEFRLVFYGPEGQRMEERRRLDPSRSQTPPGSFFYQAAGVDAGHGPASYQLGASYGIHRQLDLRMDFNQVPASSATNGEQQRFGMFSLQGYMPWLSGRMALARDWAGGTATSGTLNTGWRAGSLTLQQTWLDGFSSVEFNPSFGPIRARTQGRLNVNLFRASRLPLQVALDGQRNLIAGGGHRLRSSGQIATQARAYAIAHTLTWDRFRSVSAERDQRRGSLLVTRNFRNASLRGEAGYGLEAWHTRLSSLSLQGDALHFHPWILQGGYQRLLDRRSDQYSLALNRLEGAATLSLKASYDTDAKLFLGVGLRIGLGREPRSGRWVASARPMAAGGAVSAVAFLDPQGKGRLPDGAPALEGAGLLVNGGPRMPASSHAGVTFQPHLDAGSVHSVCVDTATLEDPFVKPLVRGYRILARPGKTVRLDFPMVTTGEISGTAHLQGPSGPEPLAGLRLELARAGADCARISGYDGFFHFADLLPGSYTLRVASGEAERLGVSLPPPRSFEITAAGSCFDGISMPVVPAPPASPLPLEEPHVAAAPLPAGPAPVDPADPRQPG